MTFRNQLKLIRIPQPNPPDGYSVLIQRNDDEPGHQIAALYDYFHKCGYDKVTRTLLDEDCNFIYIDKAFASDYNFHLNRLISDFNAGYLAASRRLHARRTGPVAHSSGDDSIVRSGTHSSSRSGGTDSDSSPLGV